MSSRLVINCVVGHYKKHAVFQVRIPLNATVDQMRDEIWKRMGAWHQHADVYELRLSVCQLETRQGYSRLGRETELDPILPVVSYSLLVDGRSGTYVVVYPPSDRRSDYDQAETAAMIEREVELMYMV
ncbi:hypothetical protein AX16_003925 [Volvariella volvacea WC 439]|nr:hypothetical protein AX16_003925 [Volvariella volvacea WC 439]